jgi:hypothetical protein
VESLRTLAASRHELHLVFDAEPALAEAWWHPADEPPPVAAGPCVSLFSHRQRVKPHREGREDAKLAAIQDWQWSIRDADAESPAWLRLQDVLGSQTWLRDVGGGD